MGPAVKESVLVHPSAVDSGQCFDNNSMVSVHRPTREDTSYLCGLQRGKKRKQPESGAPAARHTNNGFADVCGPWAHGSALRCAKHSVMHLAGARQRLYVHQDMSRPPSVLISSRLVYRAVL